MGISWNVKLSNYDYRAPSGEVVPMTYVSPISLLQYLLEKHVDVLVGGLQCPQERAQHLDAFWQGFRLHHGDHMVFEEHGGSLSRVIPLCWHGDEGRGKRRGNTVVVSLESPIGIQTALQKKRKHTDTAGCGCGCNPPDSMKQKYHREHKEMHARTLSALDCQWTNMKGHSFLQHFALFIIPSVVHHAHPQVLPEMLKLISLDFKRLFFEGLTIGGKQFCFALIAAKGDLKWFCKIALERSFQNQGRVRDRPCCHECMGGSGALTWEDLSENPVWANSRYTQRPWSVPPCVIEVPFCRRAPEKQFKRDPFHCAKVGIYRDLAGSCICWLVAKQYYGNAGDFSAKLETCHGIFRLYCTTVGRTAALRSFSRALFMYPRFSAYPWANTKGSDTMVLLSFIAVQCAGFINAPLNPAHVVDLKLMRQTCLAAVDYFSVLNHHGLWLRRPCAMAAQVELTKFVVGYGMLASRCLNDQFNGWAVKPKLHLMKHAHLEMHEWLAAGLEILPNYNVHNCEQNEDYIGRVCRLSRRLDSRRIGQRVLECCFMKSRLMHQRFVKENQLD